MSIYKKVTGMAGDRYIKDGKIIKTERVPHEVAERLAYASEWELPTATKVCLFCDAQANHKRAVNLVIVALCDYHYYSTNIGKIAEQLRKIKGDSNGTDAKEPTPSSKKIQPKAAKSKVGRQDSQKRRQPSWGERIEIE